MNIADSDPRPGPAERLQRTPSQTIGPYFGFALPWADGQNVVPEGTDGAIRLTGRVTDGAGEASPGCAHRDLAGRAGRPLQPSRRSCPRVRVPRLRPLSNGRRRPIRIPQRQAGPRSGARRRPAGAPCRGLGLRPRPAQATRDADLLRGRGRSQRRGSGSGPGSGPGRAGHAHCRSRAGRLPFRHSVAGRWRNRLLRLLGSAPKRRVTGSARRRLSPETAGSSAFWRAAASRSRLATRPGSEPCSTSKRRSPEPRLEPASYRPRPPTAISAAAAAADLDAGAIGREAASTGNPVPAAGGRVDGCRGPEWRRGSGRGAGRRGRGLRSPRGDQPGRAGHGDDARDHSGCGASARRPGRGLGGGGGPGGEAPDNAHGRTDAPPAGPPDHVRRRCRGLAVRSRSRRQAARRCPSGERSRPVRRRRWDPRIAGRGRPASGDAPRRRAASGRAGPALAYRPDSRRRTRRGAGRSGRGRGQGGPRHRPAGPDGDRRGEGSDAGPGRLLDVATEAEPHRRRDREGLRRAQRRAWPRRCSRRCPRNCSVPRVAGNPSGSRCRTCSLPRARPWPGFATASRTSKSTGLGCARTWTRVPAWRWRST